ncbi:MAG: penicillin-binding protein 2 [Patescibacteria group bacterium]|jgi:penicillin-binding protein 2
MSYDPFSTYTSSDDIRDKNVRDYSFKQHLGDEYRPEDDNKESFRLSISTQKLNYLYYFVILVFIALFCRSGYLQIAKGADYREMAEGNRIRIERIKPARGIIYDAQMRPLVENVPNFTLQAVPADIPKTIEQRTDVYGQIMHIMGSRDNDFESRLPHDKDKPGTLLSTYQPVTLIEHLPMDKAILLKIRSSSLPGIVVSADSSRHYLMGNEYSQLLGYIGKITDTELLSMKDKGYAIDDYTGKTGLERSYEAYLRGKIGRRHIEVDSLGKIKKVVASEQPRPGQSIVMSINKDYQAKLQQLLDDTVNRLRVPGGAAIALDPRNGEVLAMVTSPTYDNNLFSQGIKSDEYGALLNDPRQPLFDRSISAEVPSGSTIKPMIAAAALAEHLITPSTTVNSVGGIKIGQWYFPDWKAGGHGLTNVTKAIAESVNTFFYAIGGGFENITGLGVQRIKEYATRFGFGSGLGIDLPGEASGFIPDQAWKERVKGESWYIGDTYHMAIGQGDVMVTPLQIANMTATIANGGTWYKPHIIRAAIDPENNQTTLIEPVIVNQQVVPSFAIEPVREGMRQSVTSGSSRALSNLPVPAAGKTGTAQFTQEKTHAWFTGFAPYDHPEISVTVFIEGGGEGSATAIPIAHDFLAWYFGGMK